MSKIALNFEDGVTKIIEGLPYEKVSDAAYRNRINIPLDCADGACGTCKCKVKSGTFDEGDYIEEALTDEEAAQGYGLACQMTPESDLIIEIFASSTVCKVETQTFATTISEVNYLSPEIVQLKVQLPDNATLEFLAGQYVNIEVPGTEQTRSYSFANKGNQNELEFLIRIVPNGLMSEYLKNEAKVGASLNVTGPLGSFYLRQIEKPTLFFAGGTGIAPFLAMLESLAEEGNTNPITLYYGATTDENLVEMDRLKEFQSKLNFNFECCVSVQESSNFPKGFVTQWITKDNLTESDYDVYICGPNPMVEAVKQSLETEAIQYSNFYLEKFLPTGQTITT